MKLSYKDRKRIMMKINISINVLSKKDKNMKRISKNLKNMHQWICLEKERNWRDLLWQQYKRKHNILMWLQFLCIHSRLPSHRREAQSCSTSLLFLFNTWAIAHSNNYGSNEDYLKHTRWQWRKTEHMLQSNTHRLFLIVQGWTYCSAPMSLLCWNWPT